MNWIVQNGRKNVKRIKNTHHLYAYNKNKYRVVEKELTYHYTVRVTRFQIIHRISSEEYIA